MTARKEKITSLTFQLPVTLRARLKKIAASRGISMKKLCVTALNKIR